MKANQRQFFFEGTRTSFSPAGMILFITFFAYGALVSGSNLPLEVGIGLTIFVFAIPGQVVLVDEIARGSSLITAAIVTTFTAIRLLPLTVSMLPVVRNKTTPKWMEVVICHFVAVTVWTQSMMVLPTLPREQRASHCLGFCCGLMVLVTIGTCLGFYAAHMLPKNIAAATLMVTPIYFFLSLFNTAKVIVEKLAFAFGTIIAIPLIFMVPNFSLIGSGLIGGTLAYLIGRKVKKHD